jgi:D-alanine-D-alanine ligase
VRIGLTYDLRDDYLAMGYSEDETAEFDRVSTVEAIEGALQRRGHQTDRIGHVKALTARLAAGDRWDLVFNIAEGMYGIGREAQVPALLDAHAIPYTFSDPLVMSLTLHKGMTKRVLRDGGLPTPLFHEVASSTDIDSVCLPYPLFAKPLAEGTGKGIDGASVIRTPQELRTTCERLLATYHQPVLVETYLPGRELTTGIVGTGPAARVIGTMEVLLGARAEQGAYTYTNKELCEELVEYRLVTAQDPVIRAAEEISLAAWRLLGCRDGGRLDLRCDANGNPQLMELNPLAGLHPEHSDLPIICTAAGVSYDELIGHILDSAAARIAPVNPNGKAASLAGGHPAQPRAGASGA